MVDFFFGDNEQAQNTDSQAQISPAAERTEPWRVDVEQEQEAGFHFGPAEQRELHLQNLRQAVKGIDPQQVSAAFEVARKTGINPSLAMADPIRFREELEATPEWKKLNQAPAVQAHLSNPIMMAASQGDINALADMERLQAALAMGGARRAMREASGRQQVEDWYSGYAKDVELGFWNNIGGSFIEGLKAAGRGVDHFFAAGSEQMMGSITKAITDLGYTPEQATAYLEKGTPLPLMADEEYKAGLPWYLDPGNSGDRPEQDNYHVRSMREKVAVINDGGFPRYFYNFMKWVSDESREELDPKSFMGGLMEADREFLAKVSQKGGVYQFASDTMFGVASMANMMVFSLLGSPEIGVGMMYAQIAGGDIEKGERAGVDPGVNWRAANWNAFLQTPLEALSVSKALSVWKPQKMLGERFKRFVESVTTEGITESLQAVPEELAEAYRMADAESIFEVKDFFKRVFTADFLKNAGYQGAVGAVSAGLIGAPGVGYHAIFSRGDDAADPVRALKNSIDRLGASRESVTVLENLTGEMVKGGHLPETVYFPARQVAALFQEEKLPDKMEAALELMDIDKAEFEAALESDGEVQVSGAKLGALVATPYGEQLAAMVHLNPVEREAMGIVQGTAEQMEAGADFIEAAVTAAELAAAEKLASEPIADASPFRERIKKDLMEKARLSETKAEAYTAIIDANAHIWASLPGESIQSYYERYGYRMHKTDFGEVLAQVYEAHGKAMGVNSEIEFFNRYKMDDGFREQVNSMLQFGAAESGGQVASNPFVLDVDSLMDASIPDILSNAARVEELLAGGFDSVQVNVGGQSYVYSLGNQVNAQVGNEQEGAANGQEEGGADTGRPGEEGDDGRATSFVPGNRDGQGPGEGPGGEAEALGPADPGTEGRGGVVPGEAGGVEGTGQDYADIERAIREAIVTKDGYYDLDDGWAFILSTYHGREAVESVFETLRQENQYKAHTHFVRENFTKQDIDDPVVAQMYGSLDGKSLRDWPGLYKLVVQKYGPGMFKSRENGGQSLDELAQSLEGLGLFHDGADALAEYLKDAKGIKQRREDEGLYQGQSQPRGVHAVAADGQSIIHFFESNDTTAGHEVMHVFRRVLSDMAAHPQAPDWMRQDWATACEFVGAKVGETWTKEQEETWAKAGEAYFWEGQAPSPGLRGAFATLRRWFLNVYRTVLQIGVKVPPEVSDVMDRMLATEAEIGEARAKMDTKPMFDGEDIGELAQEYAEWAKKAAMASDPEVQRKVEAEKKRLLPKWRKDAQEHADEHEGHKVLDGIVESGGIGLQALEDMNLADEVLRTLKALRNKKIVTAGGGSPERIAAALGFESPEELISYLVSIPPKSELAEARLHELETIWRETWDPEVAIMTEQYEKLMEREAEILADSMQGQAVKGAAIKKLVRERTGQVRVGRIEMTEMEALKSVIRREAAAARKAYKEGRNEESLAAKERQRRAIAELRAKTKAKAEVKQIVNYLKRVGKAARKGTAMTADANEQIHNLLEGYDLRASVSQAEIDRRGQLAAWAQARELEGQEIDLPDHIIKTIGQIHFKQMTLDELRDLKRLAKNIETIGRAEKKIMADGKLIERKEAVGGLVRSVERNYDGKLLPEKAEFGGDDIKKRIGKGLGTINAGLTKVLTMCDRLDGGKSGWWTNTIYRPISEAIDRASVWKGKANTDLGKMMDTVYSKKELAKLKKERFHVSARIGFMTREKIIAVGFNAGNAYNLKAVKDGYGWTEQDVQDVLAMVRDKDWDFIQGVWEYLDSEFWPGIQELYKELTGNEPEKVKPEGFVTSSGKKLKGGYYPLKAKADASVRASQIEEADSVQQMLSGFHFAATTRNGHTKARKNFGGQPVDLSLSVLFGHVSNVITDLELRKAVIDVNWFLSNKKVADIVSRSLGIEAHKQMKRWLAACAGSGAQLDATGLDRWASFARRNKTVASMGFKVTTLLAQLAGFSNSVGLVGVRHMGGAMKYFLHSPRAAYRHIQENSVYMSDRRNSFDRELYDRAKKLGIKGKFDRVTEASFYLIREADFFVSSVTWEAAYSKAIENGATNDDAVFEADKAVQMSQGGGRVADLAAIQRGGEWRKLFTMFYTFFSQQYQQFQKIGYDYRRTGNKAQLIARTWWLWVSPAIISELLAGRGPDDDEDWTTWAAKETVLYPFLTVPGLREVSQGLFSEFGAQKTIFGETGEAMKNLYKEATDQDGDGVALFKKAMKFSGYLAPLPTAQADITIGQFVEYLAGEKKTYSPRDLIFRDRE